MDINTGNNEDVLVWRVQQLETEHAGLQGLRDRISVVESKLISLEKSSDDISKTLQSINLWLRGGMGSLVLALILLVLNLLLANGDLSSLPR